MNYPDIKYVDPGKLLVIEGTGKLKQLYVPIKVLTIQPLNHRIPPQTFVHVDEIQIHSQYKLVFKVFDSWYPYWAFTIK